MMMQRHNRLVVGFSVALALQSSVLFAQLKSDTPSVNAPENVITVQEQNAPDLNLTWQLVPRPPIRFTPFDMIDPSTGKPVKPDDLIEVDGVKVKAGDFYRQLNEMERWLNAHGYSLRTDTQFEYFSPELEAQMADAERRLRELEAQMPLAGEPGDSGGDFAPAACWSDSRSFDTGWHGPDLFGVRFFGDGTFQACFPTPGTSDPISGRVTGQAVISGRLANIQKDIAQVVGGASGQLDFEINPGFPIPRARLDYSYFLGFRVFGNQIWGASGSGSIRSDQGQLRYQRQWNESIATLDWTSPTIPIGCVSLLGITVCLNGQVGVNGGLYLSAGVDIQPSTQVATLTPSAYTTGWAAAWLSAGVGFIWVEAGVQGYLDFLQGSLQATALGNFASTANCLFYNFNARLDANLTALSGRLEAFVRGCIRVLWWKKCAEARLRLFSWDGIRWNQTLGSYSNSYLIGCW